jgi:hypothetical protein
VSSVTSQSSKPTIAAHKPGSSRAGQCGSALLAWARPGEQAQASLTLFVVGLDTNTRVIPMNVPGLP